MKNIKLSAVNHTGKYSNGKEQLIVCEDLDFYIDYRFGANSKVYYIADNGSSIRKDVVNDNKFSIPFEFIKTGKLSLKIEEIRNNNCQSFTVEDLLIMQNNNKIETIPEIDKLKQEIEQYSTLVKQLERKNEILVKLVGGLYDTDIKVGETNEWIF